MPAFGRVSISDAVLTLTWPPDVVALRIVPENDKLVPRVIVSVGAGAPVALPSKVEAGRFASAAATVPLVVTAAEGVDDSTVPSPVKVTLPRGTPPPPVTGSGFAAETGTGFVAPHHNHCDCCACATAAIVAKTAAAPMIRKERRFMYISPAKD